MYIGNYKTAIEMSMDLPPVKIKLTSGEYFEKNVVWRGTILVNPIWLMESYHQYLIGNVDENGKLILNKL